MPHLDRNEPNEASTMPNPNYTTPKSATHTPTREFYNLRPIYKPSTAEYDPKQRLTNLEELLSVLSSLLPGLSSFPPRILKSKRVRVLLIELFIVFQFLKGIPVDNFLLLFAIYFIYKLQTLSTI